MGSTLSSLSLLTPQPFPSAATALGDANYLWLRPKLLNIQKLDESKHLV
jgi:hypothetical protein